MHPKGDRREGFLYFLKISFQISIGFGTFSLNIQVLYGKRVGNTPELSRIYLEVVSDLKSVSKVILGSQNCIFNLFADLRFEFSSTIHFWGHTFKDPSCRIC